MRFAILEHRLLGEVHWDLLFQQPYKSLRTWATQTPPLGLGLIQAKELPPHRELYLNFQGPISGSRGWVRQWDRGTFTPLVSTDERFCCLIHGQQLNGVLMLESVDPIGGIWHLSRG